LNRAEEKKKTKGELFAIALIGREVQAVLTLAVKGVARKFAKENGRPILSICPEQKRRSKEGWERFISSSSQRKRATMATPLMLGLGSNCTRKKKETQRSPKERKC